MHLALDFIGTIFSLSCTYLLIRLNPLGWPLGLISNVINLYLFLHSQLYANCFVEVYFFCSTLYGWYEWRKYKSSDYATDKVNLMNLQQRLFVTIIITGVGFLAYQLLLHTDSTTPILDAITTSISIVAQILLARRFIETWYLWFITDSIYISLYTQKALPFHALMMCIFLGFAIKGASKWYRIFLKQIENSNAQTNTSGDDAGSQTEPNTFNPQVLAKS